MYSLLVGRVTVADEHVLVISLRGLVIVFVVVVEALIAAFGHLRRGAHHIHVVVNGIAEGDVDTWHFLISYLSGSELAGLDEVELAHAVGMSRRCGHIVVDDLILCRRSIGSHHLDGVSTRGSVHVVVLLRPVVLLRGSDGDGSGALCHAGGMMVGSVDGGDGRVVDGVGEGVVLGEVGTELVVDLHAGSLSRLVRVDDERVRVDDECHWLLLIDVVDDGLSRADVPLLYGPGADGVIKRYFSRAVEDDLPVAIGAPCLLRPVARARHGRVSAVGLLDALRDIRLHASVTASNGTCNLHFHLALGELVTFMPCTFFRNKVGVPEVVILVEAGVGGGLHVGEIALYVEAVAGGHRHALGKRHLGGVGGEGDLWGPLHHVEQILVALELVGAVERVRLALIGIHRHRRRAFLGHWGLVDVLIARGCRGRHRDDVVVRTNV